jgi:pilus assembly protein CpaB
MNKRATAAIAAGVLALLGVLVLVLWAQGANDRAFKGASLVSVVRLTQDVSAGTSAADLGSSTAIIKLPKASVPDGAITKLSQVAGLSTNASVQKGEVLLKSRMAAAGDRGKGATDVPKGFQEISVSLDAQHAVAGAVKPGDRVGLISVIDDKDGEIATANLVLHDVLVTKVGGLTDVKDITSALYTVAVKTVVAEKLSYASEFGHVWMTLQNSDTDMTGQRPITNKDMAK